MTIQTKPSYIILRQRRRWWHKRWYAQYV